MKGARDKFIVACIYRLHCKKLGKLKDLGTCSSVMLPVSLLLVQDLCDYLSFNVTREPFKSFLVSRLFLSEFFSFTSFPVQLSGLEIENTIQTCSSTQHTQPLSISISASKNMTKSTATKQPLFPFCAWAGTTPFRYACLAKHSCILGSGSIWTLRSTCLQYKYPRTGYLTRNMRENHGCKIFVQLLYITLTALHPSTKEAEHH